MSSSGTRSTIPSGRSTASSFRTRTRQEQALEASKELAKHGFRVDPPSKRDDGGYDLALHRENACDGEKPDAFVFEILDIILPLDGDYDGWGSAIRKG
jgi:hypothetical protein